MALSHIPIKISYRTGRDDMVKEFYVPCLQESVLYRRSAGYFSSHGLALAARGVAQLIANGGKMKLVVSPHLEANDISALQDALNDPAKLVRSISSRSLEQITDALVRDRLNALAWLAASGHLEIRLAIRVNKEGKIKNGLYHEKVGIFTDNSDNHIAFTGSSNETAGGLVENFESIDVYRSWSDPEGRIHEKISNFEAMWENNTEGLQIIDFSEASREILEQYKLDSPPAPDWEICDDKNSNSSGFAIPKKLNLRDYQNEAIKNWFRSNGKGIFKMATGSGKTITSLASAAMLHEKLGLDALIIVCPYRHLVTQWASELAKFGSDAILAFNARNSWIGDLDSKIALRFGKHKSFFIVITTNSTFGSRIFQSRIKSFPEKTMLIADEVHNLGATDLRTKLPDTIRFRLGLSATPERHHDDEGTSAIITYFGGILAPEFTLKDALDAGALVPYRYYPILVELTADEAEAYYELSERISKIASMNPGALDSEAGNPALEALLSQRARLVACAENKLKALEELMVTHKDNNQMLFYCGDGRVEYEPEGQLIKHINAVCQILGNKLKMKIAPFIAETALEEREVLKTKLAKGDLQGLVAIRCLDEGVDIPSIQTAVFLASSTNPRQFIQRRGRILRKDPSTNKKSAEIYDMIVIPPPNNEILDCERTLLKKELARFIEFASLSTNSGIARKAILDIQAKYNLLEI
jgi:DNA phosphorothioation system restriction enzyme